MHKDNPTDYLCKRIFIEQCNTVPSNQPVTSDIRFGFVYEQVPYITLKSM